MRMSFAIDTMTIFNLRRVGASSPHQTVGSTEEVFILVVVHTVVLHRTMSRIFYSHSGAEFGAGHFFLRTISTGGQCEKRLATQPLKVNRPTTWLLV